MASFPRLVQRGRVFYFRAAIPGDIVRYADRSEIKRSLRTADRKIANLRCAQLSLHIDNVFAEVRRMAQVQDQILDQSIREYFSAALAEGQEFIEVFAPEPEVDVQECAFDILVRIGSNRSRLSDRNFNKWDQSEAQGLVGAIPPEKVSSRYQAVQRAQEGILRAKIEADRILLAKLGGDYSKAEVLDPMFKNVSATALEDAATPAHSSISVEDAAQQYLAHISVSAKPKTVGDVRLSMDVAKAVIDFDMPIAALDIADMKAFRDLVGRLPAHYQKKALTRDLPLVEAVEAGADLPKMSYETQKKRFDMFKRFLAWAVSEEHIDRVPGNDLKLLVKKPPKGVPRRLPYSPEHLNMIFSSPVWTGRRTTKHSGVPGELRRKDGKYWVPIIALYSGMRAGEIIQLLGSDIKEQDGIWYFDVSKFEPDGEDDVEVVKGLKTGSSYRRIPIHSEILKLSFLNFVKGAGKGRLFPDIRIGSDGTYSQTWSKFWGNYGAKWKFRSKLRVFHSFRHNFVDALHEANVTDAVAMQLCGHSDDAAHWSYGKGVSISRLKEEIEKISYPVEIPGADWPASS